MVMSRTSPSRKVFEEINRDSFPLLRAAIQNGECVFFFSLSDSVKNDSFILEGIHNNNIVDLQKRGTDYFLFLRAGNCAHKIVDDIFLRTLSGSLSVRTVSNLFGSNLDEMYKKALVTDLQKVIHHQLIVNAEFSGTQEPVEFYPRNYAWLYSDEATFFSPNVVVRVTPLTKRIISSIRSKAREIMTLVYPWYLLFRKLGIPSIRQADKKTYSLGINVNLPGLLKYNYHYVDYLVNDRYGYPKNEILFVDERFKEGADNSFAQNSFDYYDTLSSRMRLRCSFLVRTIFIKFFPAWVLCLMNAFFEKDITIRVTRTILSDYVKWNIFCECYSLKKHISILLEDTISKNYILKMNGIDTWYIYPDNYSIDYHTGWDENDPVNFHSIVFMTYDHAVVFGEKTKRYLASQRNTIRTFHCTGVLSSQKVKETREGKIHSRLPGLIQEKNLTGKIIGVFDTTFVDNGPLKVHHGAQFGRDLLRLLDDMPGISIIFKEKKFLHQIPELAPIYEELEKHPRCLVIRRSEEGQIYSTEVIAQSDMVISAAYSSTNAEALGSKTRAVYYDIAGSDRGEVFYFNRFPHFVAHDYDELKDLVRYWLFESSETEFEHLLQNYVRGEIDPYLDGHAIERLQNLLRS